MSLQLKDSLVLLLIGSFRLLARHRFSNFFSVRSPITVPVQHESKYAARATFLRPVLTLDLPEDLASFPELAMKHTDSLTVNRLSFDDLAVARVCLV